MTKIIVYPEFEVSVKIFSTHKRTISRHRQPNNRHGPSVTTQNFASVDEKKFFFFPRVEDNV